MRRNRITALDRDEKGQMAFLFLFTFLIAAMFFAIAFDAGLWFFDHRTAQNQAEAAALAAVQHLPSDDTNLATAAANDWLEKNGSSVADRSCLEYSDTNGDGKFETVRVCVRRESPGLFASLSGISVANVSASATAMIGPVDGANVMPWSIIPPLPDCLLGQNCSYDANGDGDYLDADLGDCNSLVEPCPWGLRSDLLFGFKSGGGGNTGIIEACGNGNSGYVACITGTGISEFFQEGTEVFVGLKGGNLGTNTDKAISERQSTQFGEGNFQDCDVAVSPIASSGVDPDGKDDAVQLYKTDGLCLGRLVLIPILESMPENGCGSCSLKVLGVATFAMVSWNRDNNKDAWGTEFSDCTPQQGGQPPADEFECGMVWGFLIEEVTPPNYLLQQISGSNNPFAPLLIALID